jgi:hypothetical protein
MSTGLSPDISPERFILEVPEICRYMQDWECLDIGSEMFILDLQE